MAFVDSFQEKIWQDKYQYREETFDEFCDRIVYNIFKDDKEIEYREKLLKGLKNFEILFGGRINSNIGIDEKGLTLFNCFIMSIGGGADSLEGILDSMARYTKTLKTEGGVGFCANFLRPAGTLIRKIGVTTPGSIKFLEGYDKLSEIITAGNVNGSASYQGTPTKKSIRKGATMVTMSICHPDIEDFITAKSVPNRLMRMNMSVLVEDGFIEALEADADWDLWFPDTSFEKYDVEWDGNFKRWKEKGYPFVVYRTVKADYLWDLLLKSSYNRNEPGIIFIDNATKMDNLFYLLESSMLSCNPCAEVLGNTGMVKINDVFKLVSDVCDLGSVNAVKFYNVSTKKFDEVGFLNSTELAARALDGVIDVSGFPLDEYRDGAVLKRKIGVGIAGIGSLMMMMSIRYGSKECLDFLEPLLVKFMNRLYQTSALMAKEKGPFPLYDPTMLEGGYVKNSGVLTEETIDMIRKHGLRNSALCAIAPNGTLSILAGNVSGGLEPVFDKEYDRWVRVEGQRPIFEYPDIHKGEWYETEYFREDSVGSEKMLLSVDDKYRVDKSNGLCRKETIQDYGYKIAKENGFTETAGSKELSIEEHLSVLGLFARIIDQSASKTISMPNDISFDEFKSLYGKLYKLGIKGCTTYRDGTMVGVLETNSPDKLKSIAKQQEEFLDAFKEQQDGVVAKSVRLPEEYPARGYILKADGKKWYVHVSFKDKAMTKPYAIFVNTNNPESNISTFNALDKLEELAVSSGLPPEFLEETERKYNNQKNPVKVCRMLGLLLRHNVDIILIVKALDQVEEATVGTFVHRIKKFLAQFITDYDEIAVCPQCGEKTLVFKEGCFLCNQCFYSKCG